MYLFLFEIILFYLQHWQIIFIYILSSKISNHFDVFYFFENDNNFYLPIKSFLF